MDIHTATEVSYKNGYEKGFQDGIKKFAGTPTADVVEVKHSQWVVEHYEYIPKDNAYFRKYTIIPYNKGLDLCDNSWPFCANCGEGAIYNAAGDIEITNYCPNCGAKMDLKAGDE